MSLKSSIAGICPSASGVADVSRSSYQRDTLDTAKQKVVDKLQANKRYLLNDCQPIDGKTPDKCFVYAPHKGGYFAGVKYGNQWLQNVFGEGQNKFGPLNKQQLTDVIDLVVVAINENELDDAIRKAMKP